MPSFLCRIAGVVCEIEYHDPDVPGWFAGYLIPSPQVETSNPVRNGDGIESAEVSVNGMSFDSASKIHVPYQPNEVARICAEIPSYTPAQAEWAAAYAVISEALPRFGCFVFHGACVEYGGKAYVFTAPSGTGKSTHIMLWRQFLGEAVNIVNGDKPIIAVDRVVEADGGPVRVFACGSPWGGKEGWQRNVTVPLGGICFLNRQGADHVNSCVRVTPDEVLDDVAGRVFIPRSPEGVASVLSLLDTAMKTVPLFESHVDISEDAVRTSFKAMTGQQLTSSPVSSFPTK